MKTMNQKSWVLAVAFAALLAVTSAHALSNKWRIKFNGKADVTGTLVFVVTPDGGEPIEVSAVIEEDTHENAAAKQMVKAFKAALPKDDFHIERDDWEDVLVKKRLGADRFDLKLESEEIKGLKIRIKKE